MVVVMTAVVAYNDGNEWVDFLPNYFANPIANCTIPILCQLVTARYCTEPTPSDEGGSGDNKEGGGGCSWVAAVVAIYLFVYHELKT